MSKKIRQAKWKEMVEDDGTILEAVFRSQEAQSEKVCARQDCELGGRILPTMRYVRVFYEDESEVESFHVACFRKEFAGVSPR